MIIETTYVCYLAISVALTVHFFNVFVIAKWGKRAAHAIRA